MKHRLKRHLFLFVVFLLLLFIVVVFKMQGTFEILPFLVNRQQQAQQAEKILKSQLAKEVNRPALQNKQNRGKSEIALSFTAVKKLLLTSDRKSLGGVGKILTSDGKFYGYQIVRLPEGSFFYNLGGRKGDIIRKLEADSPVELSSDLDLYALLLRLPEVPQISITMERDNRLQKFTFINNDLKQQ